MLAAQLVVTVTTLTRRGNIHHHFHPRVVPAAVVATLSQARQRVARAPLRGRRRKGELRSIGQEQHVHAVARVAR
jgi:hypothetical protein